MNGKEVLGMAGFKGRGGSSSSESSSGSSSSGEESSSSSSGDNTSQASLWKEDMHGPHLVVTCAENEAKFYRERFARGSIGKCVLFRGGWLTPNEFQAVSGRQSSKDWKRSIRLNGRCLKDHIGEGLFKEHPKFCTCGICRGVDEELRRQEGVLALAAKRRRLSQAADASHSTQAVQPVSDNDGGVLEAESAESDAPVMVDSGTKRKANNSTVKKRKRGRPPKNRVWSPSGEVAQEGSSNDEDYQPGKAPHLDSDPAAVIDAADYLPRRSQHGMYQKPDGHRTELGTYPNKPVDWDTEEVADFLRTHGFANYADSFQEYDINGKSLFLLKEHHLLEKLSMKLGPTLRLLDTISKLQHPPTIFDPSPL